MARLIVNADDLGRSRGVNDGIARAHREGIVTSATLMANARHAPEAGALARDLPSLDVGVHLVLTYARPLTDPLRIPSLVEAGGGFPKLPHAPEPDEALLEYRAQYERARDLVGREPTHLDSHHWVHDDPALEWAIGELALETGAAVRQQSEGQRDRLRARGVRTPDSFCRDFQHEGRIGVPELLALLDRVALDPGTTELMCHPAEADAELAETSSYARERAVELATLTDTRVRERIGDRAILLTTFRALA